VEEDHRIGQGHVQILFHSMVVLLALPPQVTEHVAQSVQSSQPPSTRNRKTIVYMGKPRREIQIVFLVIYILYIKI
jgi:hypothetical protein